MRSVLIALLAVFSGLLIGAGQQPSASRTNCVALPVASSVIGRG